MEKANADDDKFRERHEVKWNKAMNCTVGNDKRTMYVPASALEEAKLGCNGWGGGTGTYYKVS